MGGLLLFQNCSKVDFAQSSLGEDSAALTSTGGSIQGVISDALTGTPISGATVVIRASDGAVKTVSSSGSGQYSSGPLSTGTAHVDISMSGYITVSSIPAEIVSSQVTSLNQSLSPSLAANQVRIVLNWTGPKIRAVRDVDAYLSVPGATYPVYFDNPVTGGVQLDIDIVNWLGPETITINSLSAGTYVYYVNNYDTRTDTLALGNSDIRINVYRGSSLIKSYAVPAGTGITYEVFRITDGQIYDQQKYNDTLPIARGY